MNFFPIPETSEPGFFKQGFESLNNRAGNWGGVRHRICPHSLGLFVTLAAKNKAFRASSVYFKPRRYGQRVKKKTFLVFLSVFRGKKQSFLWLLIFYKSHYLSLCFDKQKSENAAAYSANNMGKLRNIIICKNVGNLFSQENQ